MPTYVFCCPKCGNILEQIMTISEYSTTHRPKCCVEGCDGQQTMEPQITGGTGFVLKGTGWTPKGSESFGAPTDILHRKKR
jgi:predicted nucleic acid-binding Zn ribbon protein